MKKTIFVLFLILAFMNSIQADIIMKCLFALMIQINSSESYKLGMISEEAYRKYLSEQQDQFEKIKELLNND